MKKQFKLSLILISVIIISVFTSSCGLSSFFVALNDIAFDIINNSNNESTDETTTTETTETTTPETTVQETTETPTVGQTVGIKNSDNIQVDNTTSPAAVVAETPTVTDITTPQDYTVAESNTAASIVASLNPSDAYSAAKAFHDWIISHTVYTTDLTYNNADGVFTYGQSACLGYSLAFESLMDAWSLLHPEANVDTKVAYGDNDTSTPNIGHAWNMVRIAGSWYHLDATWDDNGSVSVYDYFLVPNAVISQSRVTYYVDNFQSAPAANSTAYEFGIKDQGVPTTVALSSLSTFSDVYFSQIQSGVTTLTFFYPSSEDVKSLAMSNKLKLLLNQKGYSTASISYRTTPLYSNGTYSNYYFFTITPQV